MNDDFILYSSQSKVNRQQCVDIRFINSSNLQQRHDKQELYFYFFSLQINCNVFIFVFKNK